MYISDQSLPLYSLSYIRHCLERDQEILFLVLEKEKNNSFVSPSVFGLTLVCREGRKGGRDREKGRERTNI